MTSPSTTASVGNGADNDRSPPSQQDSGGNGGAQLTQSNALSAGAQSQSQLPGAPARKGQSGDGRTDATAANRTASDTGGDQAGSTGHGLGAAETGGNQDAFDMPKA
ncbi:hypothetical protein [Massilia sp. PWRC2]|uniref:hypothetical protein n=1 Tax=Massilia sp. PWRC2 TaxID=2804626 RepID=UPI003CE6C720